MALKERYGEWALITGASSGIGREFARQLAQSQFNLVLIARREERLKALALELKKLNGIHIVVIPLDLSKPHFITSIEKEISGINIGLLINNAGITVSSNFLESDLEKQLEVIDVNIKAVTNLTYFFCKKMMTKGKGGVINVASASGFLPVPKWSVYAASKAYVLHFTEALWYEFKVYGIDILALCPGATSTEFGNNLNQQIGMNAADVVKTALRNLSQKPSVIPGFKNKIGVVAMLRLFGRKTLIKLGAKVVKAAE
jgi:uncharacterized protein